MVRYLICCAFAVLSAVTSLQANEHPLLVGVRLAETRFSGWRYGHREYRKQINCVQFMVAVVEELVHRELSPEERKLILINDIGRKRNLRWLVPQNDERIRGIQTALLRMGKGEVVSPSQARTGDFIQYWRIRNGRWIGHASIIIDVSNENGVLCASVFGAHQSLRRVGIGGFEVGLNDPGIKAFIVRFKS